MENELIPPTDENNTRSTLVKSLRELSDQLEKGNRTIESIIPALQYIQRKVITFINN